MVEVDDILKFVDGVAVKVRPQRIVLFGSYGPFSPTSFDCFRSGPFSHDIRGPTRTGPRRMPRLRLVAGFERWLGWCLG